MKPELRPPKAQAIRERRHALNALRVSKRLDKELEKAAVEYREQMEARHKWKRDMLIASYREYEPPESKPNQWAFKSIFNFFDRG